MVLFKNCFHVVGKRCVLSHAFKLLIRSCGQSRQWWELRELGLKCLTVTKLCNWIENINLVCVVMTMVEVEYPSNGYSCTSRVLSVQIDFGYADIHVIQSKSVQLKTKARPSAECWQRCYAVLSLCSKCTIEHTVVCSEPGQIFRWPPYWRTRKLKVYKAKTKRKY